MKRIVKASEKIIVFRKKPVKRIKEMMTMAKMVAHMGRMKKGNMNGIEGHNKRLFKNHTNKDIDTSKSHLNYDLVTCSGSYLDAYQDEMNKYYTGKKAPRKDAVLCNEWIFSASNDFFQNLSADDEKRFFESCLDFMKSRYGHVIYATVHKDESTPHMHLGMIPLTVDGRLSNKSIFTRTELKKLHTALYEHLTQDGFALEKPQPNDSKHLEVLDFKIAKRQEHIEKQNKAIAKNAMVLNNQQQQYKSTQTNIDKKKKEIEETVNAQTKKFNDLKSNALADINKREKALTERESTYKATLDKRYKDEYDERKRTLDAFYAKENDKLTERESEVRYKEYELDEREKDINKRDAEVERKERNFANKYNKAVRLVKNADSIEKRIDESMERYQKLKVDREDTAFIPCVKTALINEYGKNEAERIFDVANDILNRVSDVNTYEYDDYKQFKRQTVKSKQADDLEF